ncbi:PAS domain S-box protein [Caulobacter sp. SLTY]|uniref:PAS domain S-box protein n=1 Tax=Caulobacter sp. SLTY TaxID=2683262 RepID=UPI0014121D52|nr:PAS domain S-box protein [Caulobacter sp. SLTY]NBB16852.1 PAS domain S-box protein [Caulobacter sp. SLTY]
MKALAALNVMDTLPEARFDRITALASDLFDAPIALVSLVDDHRQWFKSRVGLEACSTDRSLAFCAFALDLGPSAVMVVEDATRDSRFVDNPLVTQEPKIRFYMGANLTTPEGYNLGTLCVIDTRPRSTPSERDQQRLRQLAQVVVDELVLGQVARQAAEKHTLLRMAETMSGVGHWRLDLASGGIEWSDEVYGIHGVRREEFDPNLGEALLFYPPEDREAVESHIADAIASRTGFQFQLRLRRPDGALRHVTSKAVCEIGALGEPVALFGLFQDVTEHQTRLDRVRKSEARYRLLADNAGDVITLYDAEGGGLYSSPALERLLGYASNDAKGMSAADFLHPDDQEVVRAAFSALAQGQAEATVQHRSRHRSGKYVWVETNLRSIQNGPEDPASVLGVSRDVTERKALEAETLVARDQAREQAQRALLAEDIAGVGYWRVDLATNDLFLSPKMYEIYGIRADEQPTADDILAQLHPEERVEELARVAQRLKTGEAEINAVFRIIRRDGEVRHLRGSSIMEFGPDGARKAVLGTVIDITDIIAARQAVAESEARYRRLAEQATDIIARTNLDGQIEFITPSVQHTLGYSPETFIGRMSTELIHPDDRALVARVYQDLLTQGDDAPTPQVRYRGRHADGRWVWLEGRPRVVFDPGSNTPIGYQDLVRDVSVSVAAEEAVEQARAAAEASAAAKTDFLANMSHELRTPLTSVLGFSRLIKEQPELSANTRRFVDRVMNAGAALLATVNDILDFSKLEAGQIEIKRQPASALAVLSQTVELFGVQAEEKGLSLHLDAAEHVPDLVLIDADRLRQVLLNLVGNAVKFTEVGEIRIHAHHHDGALHIAVVDTGDGIAKDLQAKLFQRFSQVDASPTRSHGGTGLGLAICKGLVTAMGGDIGLTSEPGQGARFYFSIPAPEVEPIGPRQGLEVGQGLPAGFRVLVADDNTVNLDLIGAVLRGLGVEVTTASDGRSAVDIALGAPFDAILMDLRMPGLEGPDAAREIRGGGGVNAETPILAFSADVTSPLDAELFDGLIAKPIDPTALLTALAAIFEPEPKRGAA